MLITSPTNQGVVGSNPAGRAKFQRLGNENQVLLSAVGPVWDKISTGPDERFEIHAVGFQQSYSTERPLSAKRSAFRLV